MVISHRTAAARRYAHLPHRLLRSLAIVTIVTMAGRTPAAADVVDADARGFTVSHRVTVAAPRSTAYDAVVNGISLWWSNDHTVSGNAANLYLDAEPQGCFCERLGDGAGLVHMTVTFVNPGVILRLTGGLGPLGLMGVNGNMTFEFDDGDEPGTSLLTLRYAVGGYLADGLDAVAPAVDQVLGEQLERLQRHIARP